MNELRQIPPHQIEAEQSLLGAILVNNEALYVEDGTQLLTVITKKTDRTLEQIILGLCAAGLVKYMQESNIAIVTSAALAAFCGSEAIDRLGLRKFLYNTYKRALAAGNALTIAINNIALTIHKHLNLHREKIELFIIAFLVGYICYKYYHTENVVCTCPSLASEAKAVPAAAAKAQAGWFSWLLPVIGNFF